jgi:transposase
MLGSLGVVQGMLRRVGIQEIIDQVCPIRDVAPLTHGQVIDVLVANRLSSPRPLYHVDEWAEHWAVEEVFAAPAHLLNDDRLGRALDAIAPQLDTLKRSVAWAAIDAFGVDTAQFHWDYTSLSVFGAYEDQSEAGPQVTYGHSKARRPDLKQVMIGSGVTADGAVPLYHTTQDGSTAEVAQVISAMESLKAIARRDDFLLVGDTKLISTKNILAACQAGVFFCAPAPTSTELREAFGQISRSEFQPLDYLSERERHKPDEERAVFLGTERPWTLGDRKSGEQVTVRRLFVISSEEQIACRKNRVRQMEKAEAVLRKVENNLGTRWYDTVEKVRLKVEEAMKANRVSPFYQFEIGAGADQPTFHWNRNAAALARAEELDGFYVLVTNLPADRYDPTQVLQRYKGQYRVERRFHDYKGPLAISPLFVKNNERIAALVFVVWLALLVYSLIEREVRKAVADQGGKLKGLISGGTALRPTAQNILRVFEYLMVLSPPGTKQGEIVLPELTPIQRMLHQILAIPMPFSS